jgi:hypothetical protein
MPFPSAPPLRPQQMLNICSETMPENRKSTAKLSANLFSPPKLRKLG